MTPLVPILLFGWLPLTIAVFAILPPRRALMLTFVAGWLFLPMAGYGVEGLPDYTKVTAVSLGGLLGLLIFGGQDLAALKLGRYDLPMLAWCAVPAMSSLANGNGPYDAAAVTLARLQEWGIPYFLGRTVFRDLASLGYLARCVLLGGLAYMPFCLFEVRMSPQLHSLLYGFAQHDFGQHVRMGGYRPLVFMQHGLMVALWMAIATLAGLVLWRRGGLRSLLRFPAGPVVLALLATTILCKSMGALALLGAGLAAIAAVRVVGGRLPVYVLLAAPALFVGTRLGLGWQAEGLVGFLETFAPDRAASLEWRIYSEQVFVEHVWQRPWLGWSSWGVEESVEVAARGQAVRDSYWLITFMTNGLVGLAFFFGMFLVPTMGLLRRLSPREWTLPEGAGATVLIVALGLYQCDCMLNAMINPVYTLMLGAVTAVAAGGRSQAPAVAPVGREPRRPRRRFVHLPT